jgi:endonuclease G
LHSRHVWIQKISFLLVIILLFCYCHSHPAPESITSSYPNCKHFLYGCPTKPDNDNILIIRDIYALSINAETKLADWVAYRLDPILIRGSREKHKRTLRPDPWVSDSCILERADYKDAFSLMQIEKGHLCPRGSVRGSRDWQAADYFSNIAPQKTNLNHGAWNKLEIKIRDLVNIFTYVYVVTGPLYERKMPMLPNADEKHRIPSGYWKIVAVEIDGMLPIFAAFVFNQDIPEGAGFLESLTTVNDVESRCGYNLFWQLDDHVEDSIEGKINHHWCRNYLK